MSIMKDPQLSKSCMFNKKRKVLFLKLLISQEIQYHRKTFQIGRKHSNLHSGMHSIYWSSLKNTPKAHSKKKKTPKFHSKIPLPKPLHSMNPFNSSTPLQVLAYALMIHQFPCNNQGSHRHQSHVSCVPNLQRLVCDNMENGIMLVMSCSCQLFQNLQVEI